MTKICFVYIQMLNIAKAVPEVKLNLLEQANLFHSRKLRFLTSVRLRRINLLIFVCRLIMPFWQENSILDTGYLILVMLSEPVLSGVEGVKHLAIVVNE